MKNLEKITFLLGILSLSFSAQAQIANWKQPPAMCVEDVKAQRESLARSNKITLENKSLDHKSDDYVDAYTAVLSAKKINDKIDLVYKAADEVSMPPQVLLGALLQESSFFDSGVEVDGGGYSCGISQVQIEEWCEWAKTLSPTQAKKINFPLEWANGYEKRTGLDVCDELASNEATQVFYNRAYTNPKLMKVHPALVPSKNLAKFRFADMESALPATNEDEKRGQYLMAKSFLENCDKHKYAIFAMAHLIRSLYDQYVPGELKHEEFYEGDEHYNRSCARIPVSKAYPYNTGWLLAVALDNAGESIARGITKYKTKSFSDFHPNDLLDTMLRIAQSGELYDKTPLDWEVVMNHVMHVIGRTALSPHDMYYRTHKYTIHGVEEEEDTGN